MSCSCLVGSLRRNSATRSRTSWVNSADSLTAHPSTSSRGPLNHHPGEELGRELTQLVLHVRVGPGQQNRWDAPLPRGGEERLALPDHLPEHRYLILLCVR